MTAQPRLQGWRVEGGAQPNRSHPMRTLMISCLALAIAAGCTRQAEVTRPQEPSAGAKADDRTRTAWSGPFIRS